MQLRLESIKKIYTTKKEEKNIVDFSSFSIKGEKLSEMIDKL